MPASSPLCVMKPDMRSLDPVALLVSAIDWGHVTGCVRVSFPLLYVCGANSSPTLAFLPSLNSPRSYSYARYLSPALIRPFAPDTLLGEPYLPRKRSTVRSPRSSWCARRGQMIPGVPTF